MSMTIRISGEDSRGKRSLLNDAPLAEYTSDEVLEMKDSAISVSIFIKDETRADEAKSLLSSAFSHFKGDIVSKATKYGWVVTQEANATRDDSKALLSALAM